MAAAATQETYINRDDITEVVTSTITTLEDPFTAEQKTYIKMVLEEGFYAYRYHETDGHMDWFDNLLDFTIPEHKGIFATIWLSCVYPTINICRADYSSTNHQNIIRHQMYNIIRYIIVTKHTRNERAAGGSPTNEAARATTEFITNQFITNRVNFTDDDKSFILSCLHSHGFKHTYYAGEDPMKWFNDVVDFDIRVHQGILAGMWFNYVAYGGDCPYDKSDVYELTTFESMRSIQMKCNVTMLLRTEAFHKALRHYGIVYDGF